MLNIKLIIKLFLFIPFTGTIHAQYYVGNYNEEFFDSSRSNRAVLTEVYFPTIFQDNDYQVAYGQFPVIIFGHGLLVSSNTYQNLWEEFVPRGYIMVFPRTEEGLINDHQEFGWDLQFLVTKMQEEGNNNDSPIFNAVANNSALMGHSMGGGAAFLAADSLCQNENIQLKTIIGLAPAESSSNGVSSINSSLNITIPALILSGSRDGVTHPDIHHIPIYDNLNSDYKTFISILDGAHCYFGEPNFFCDLGETTASSGIAISREDQQNITNDFLNLWLDFTLKDSCQQYVAFQDSIMNSNRITYDQIHQENLVSTVIENNGVLSSSIIGETYQWYINDYPLPLANNVFYTPNDSGNYSVEVFFTNGCPTISDSYSFYFLAANSDKLLPNQFLLYQNYPNPFNPSTTIRYQLKYNGLVHVSIFDLKGGIVKKLVDNFQKAGMKSITWNGINHKGELVPAGIYLYVLRSGNFIKKRKMLFVK